MATRGEFLAISGASVLAACARTHALSDRVSASSASPTAEDLHRFMDASKKLTGYGDLNPTLGALYLGVILTDKNRAEALDALYKDNDFNNGRSITEPVALSVATQIQNNWYSGIYQTANGPTSATWTDALAWKACRFTKAPSICAVPGSWAKPPMMNQNG